VNDTSDNGRPDSTEKRLDPLAVIRDTPLSLLGLALLFGWAWLAFLSPDTLFANEPPRLTVVRTSWAVALTVNLALWVFLLVTRNQSLSLAANRRLLVSLAVLVPLGTLTASLVTVKDALSWALQLLGMALAALGTTFLPVIWHELCGRLDARRAAVVTGATAVLSLVIYLTVLAIPDATARIIIAALLPAGCAALTWVSARKLTPESQAAATADTEPGAPGVTLSRTLALVPAGLGLAFGLMLSSIDFLEGSGSAAFFAVLIGGLGTPLLLAGAAIFARRLDFFQFTYRLVVPVIAAGLILIPLGTPAIAVAVILGGFLVFDLTSNSQISETSRRFGIPPLWLGMYARTVSHAGILVGMGIGRFVSGNDFFSETQLLIAAMLLLWILLLALTYTMSSDKVRTLQPQQTECTCHDVAVAYGLSAREEEVLELLVQGRSLPYVQRELYISLSTAKFHVTNIYAKFDVHARQDLLDAVAAARSGTTPLPSPPGTGTAAGNDSRQ